jgi:hypothetical protein
LAFPKYENNTQSVAFREGDKLKDIVGNLLPVRIELAGTMRRCVVRFVTQYSYNMLKLKTLTWWQVLDPHPGGWN